MIAAILVVAVFAWAWDRSSQPDTGDGWRLLGRQRAIGEQGSVTAITDADALTEAWDELRLRDAPAVDFGTDAVYWLVAKGTIGCPSRLDGITFDPVARTVTGAFSLGLTAGCDRAAVSDSFLVAVDRGRLPAEPFEVRLVGP